MPSGSVQMRGRQGGRTGGILKPYVEDADAESDNADGPRLAAFRHFTVRSARTCSTCPFTPTFGYTFSTLRSLPTTKVLRMIPM